eukprot:958362-Prorocentrum_lima.AAC.1
MTSSLVGSEMCIRDSMISSLDLNLVLLLVFLVAVETVEAWFEDCAPEPVSYTHLTLPTICSV